MSGKGEIMTSENRDARLKAIDDAAEIMADLTHELHHQVHAPECRCEYGIRKLLNAVAYLRATHWAGMPAGLCARMDSGVDVREVRCTTGATVTQLSVASHYGNITCPLCRKAAWVAGVR